MTQNTLRFRRIASRSLGIAATLGFVAAASCSAENSENVGAKKSALSPNGIVIAEVYGGGGNTNAPFNADYVLLFNKGNAAASINGMFLQYAGAGVNFAAANAIALPNVSIQPGKYFLVQMSAAGATGVALPAPDLTATPAIAMGGTAGKVALTTVALDACGMTATQCSPTNISDLVGYGTTAQQFEGTGPTPAPSNTASAHRKGAGCTDSDDNSADFEAGAPTPKNSGTAANTCGTSTDAGSGGTGGTDAATGGTGGVVDASTGGTGGAAVDAGPPPVGLVIADVYGGAGPSGPVAGDYIVVFNRGTAAASLANVYVQYASAAGNFGSFAGNTVPLSGTLGVGQYYLVAGNVTDAGTALPTPDATSATMNLSSANGKVALSHGAPLTCGAPGNTCSGPGLLDLVGYGAGISQVEGSGAGPAMSFTTSVIRKQGGCQDTNDNAADTFAGAPAPKNTGSPLNDCSNPPDAGSGGTGGTGGTDAGVGGTAGAATGGTAGAATGGTAGAATGGTAGAATGGTGGATGGTGGGTGATGGSATGGTSSGGTGGKKDGGVGNVGGFAGKPAGGGSGDDGGCGCETPGNAQNSSGLALLSLLGLAAFARRRRS